MRHRLQEAESMGLEEYQKLLDERARCRAIYAKLSSICDACITLSAPGPAPVGITSTGDPTFAIPASLLVAVDNVGVRKNGHSGLSPQSRAAAKDEAEGKIIQFKDPLGSTNGQGA